jgi:hypothetical protein
MTNMTISHDTHTDSAAVRNTKRKKVTIQPTNTNKQTNETLTIIRELPYISYIKYANMTGASKIPPHIARELGRHLKPRSKGPGGSSAGKGQKDNGKLYTFLGCTAFIGITASFPYFGMAWIGRLTDKDEVRLSMNS